MLNELKITERYVLFWRGWPSQWIKSPFVIDGVTYNCCEQFMMAEKARVFSDAHTLGQILASTSPKAQKALGRQVSNFDAGEWNRVCRGIVYTANLARFAQNEPLRKLLLDTRDRIMVEASPVDQIWGIGLGQDDANSLDESKWKGSNWLGVALMQARQTLTAEASGHPSELDDWLREQLTYRKMRPTQERKL
jgi:ribA/ribD-fused uncharacterized protein